MADALVGSSYSNSVAAAVVIAGLVAIALATLAGSAFLPDSGGEELVAGTNAAIGLITAAIGAYARASSEGATQRGLEQFEALVRTAIGQKGRSHP